MLGAFIVAAVCLWYDVGHHRYQLRAWVSGGDYMYEYTYLTWWWYGERHTSWFDLEQHPYQIRTWSILGLYEHRYRYYEERPTIAQ